MFNLIMISSDWNSNSNQIAVSRVFEHTDAHITEQYQQNGDIFLDRLMSLPCLFMQEGRKNQIAHVGHIFNARVLSGNVVFDFRFDADVPTLENNMIYSNRMELDMSTDFEFHRNHWAVKNIDLYRFLLQNIRPRRQNPSVFKIGEHENIDPALVSAMMPFDAAFTSVYNSIRLAAEQVQLRCRRADDIWENASIIQDVVSLIDRSRVVVCDCTGKNPNVFYEVGIAHTLGREVILITQNEGDIPFDVGHLRHIKYLNNTEGLEALKEALQARMQTLLGH